LIQTDRDQEFRAYVLRARPGLVRTATLLTAGDSHLAEDVVQGVLTRLYLAWPRIRTHDGPDAFARRSLVNAVIDDRRRLWRRRETSHAEVPERAAPDDFDSPEDGQLLAALAGLPPGMRAAVVLRHVHGLDVAATADAMACSEGNVKSQTARGLDRLRIALAHLPSSGELAITSPRSTS
jgi:RNA polymerase sigma-70 factor (sigma-E family)